MNRKLIINICNVVPLIFGNIKENYKYAVLIILIIQCHVILPP